jgi:hypothetical protein
MKAFDDVKTEVLVEAVACSDQDIIMGFAETFQKKISKPAIAT